MIEFLMELKANPSLENFYRKLSINVRNMNEFVRLKDVYKDEFSKAFGIWTHFEQKQKRFS